MVAITSANSGCGDWYSSLFEEAAVGLARVALDGTFIEVNQHLCRITGFSRDELVGLRFQDITHPQDLTADLENIDDLLSGVSEDYSMNKRYVRKNGGEVWVNLRASLVRTAGGHPDYFVAVVEDISERKAAEKAVVESEARLRSLLDQLFAFVGVLSPDGLLLHANAAPLHAAGITLDDVLGKFFPDAYWWSYDAGVQQELKAAILRAAAGETVRYDVPVRMANEHLINIDFQIAPMRDDDGNIIGLIPSGIDIDERKAAERHNELLIAELNHRVKNSLAIVQHLARQSFKAIPEARAALADFQQRLMALASAHTLLTDGSWQQTSLAELIERTTSAGSSAEGRIEIDGPEVLLPPRAAVTMAMAIHELCTNAVKYGALSNDGGKVRVSWTAQPAPLRGIDMRWEERDGPRIEEPTHKGFGSRMIEQALALELQGTVKLTFGPEGLVCQVSGKIPVEPVA